MPNPMAQGIKECQGNGHKKTVEDLLVDAGVEALKEDSNPEEIHIAISKFVSVTENLDFIKRGLAKSEIIKKLKEIKVTGSGELVRGAFKKSDSDGDSKQGEVLCLEDPEPWPDEVDGSQLLDDLTKIFKRYLILPDHGAEAMALWTLHSWAIDAAHISPLLILESPEKRCGKTTTLTLLSALGPSPIPASSISPASLFRAVEKYQPLLLIDEADRALKNSEELNCIINASHNRNSAVVIRTVGEDHEPRMFRTWCPKAIAAIGQLQGTLEDRGIILHMRRKSPREKVDRLRGDRLSEFEPLRQKALRWTQDNIQTLAAADPETPEKLHDRAADNWRALIAICDLVGEIWPETGRRTAIEISGTDSDEDAGLAIQLLSDIRDIFEEQDTDRFPTREIICCLAVMEERQWGAFGKKEKPITPNQLSRILRRFKIRSGSIRLGDNTPKGYYKKDFEDSWMRYLHKSECHTATSLHNKDLKDFQNETQDHDVADEKGFKSNENKVCGIVADENKSLGDKKAKETLFEEKV